MRTISDAGRALVESCEGLRLNAYPDRGGVPTIGYGHTGPDVHLGQHINQTEAVGLLEVDLAEAERGISEAVTWPINQAQFDALVSLAFNEGVHAIANSTLVHKLNLGDVAGAADEFPRWNKSAGSVDPVLVLRRAKERDLFLTLERPS